MQIALIGLNRIGASIGMALEKHKEQFYRLGNDRSMLVARDAKKKDAIDDIEVNLPKIVRKSDIVVLCLPADEIKNTFDAIVEDLKEEAVIIDGSMFKSAEFDYIQNKMPQGRHFISFTPSINSEYLLETSNEITAARADLFLNGLMIISYPPCTSDEALKLAADLATLLGAGVLFADPDEVDGLIATSRLLPQLTAASMVQATMRQPGWCEARKVAGMEYAHATAPLISVIGERSAGQGMLVNQENTIRVIDDLVEVLKAVRQIIQSGDENSLHVLLDGARKERQEWWEQRKRGEWDQYRGVINEFPTSSEAMSHLFLGGLRKRKKGTN